MSHDSLALGPQYIHTASETGNLLVTIAVDLFIAQSDAQDSPPCCIVDIASYSNSGGLLVKRNTR